MSKAQTLLKKYRRTLLILTIVIFSYKDIVSYLEGVGVDVPIFSKNIKIEECKKLILDQLSAPSTAVFTETKYSKDITNSVIIKGSVDSENALGGMVRSDFICNKSEGNDMDSIIRKEGEFSDTYDTLFKTRESMM